MKLLKPIFVLVFVLCISFVVSIWFGDLYAKLLPDQFSGSFIPTSTAHYIAGLPLAFLFFLPLLFTAFGGPKKYWWIGILAIPALAFEMYFDPSHIYIPLTLLLIGSALGLGIQKLQSKKF